MTCNICRSAQQDGFEGYKDLNCAGINTTTECKKLNRDGTPSVPKLTQDNEKFVNGFLPRIAAGLFTGNGGYDYGAIRLVFDVYDIHDTTEKQSIMDKCLVIIAAHSEARRRKSGKP